MAARPPDLSALAAADGRTRLRLLTRYVRELIAEVAGLSAPPPADVGLFDLGIESLHAVEVKGRLELAYGLELEDTLLIDEPTVASIARLLDERLGKADTAPAVDW